MRRNGKRWWRLVPAMAMVGLLPGVAFLAGCRSAPVPVVLREQTITGNAALRVLNNSDHASRVFFDGDYVGMVERDSARLWHVPAGSHAVKVDASGIRVVPLVSTYEFVAGSVWTLTVTWKDIDPESRKTE